MRRAIAVIQEVHAHLYHCNYWPLCERIRFNGAQRSDQRRSPFPCLRPICPRSVIVLLNLQRLTQLGARNHEANYVLDDLSRALGVRHRLRFAAFRAQLRHSKPASFAGRCRPDTADERHLCVEADERSLRIKVLRAFLLDGLPLFAANATVVKRLESLVGRDVPRGQSLGRLEFLYLAVKRRQSELSAPNVLTGARYPYSTASSLALASSCSKRTGAFFE